MNGIKGDTGRCRFCLIAWWLCLLLGTLPIRAAVPEEMSLAEYRTRLAQARKILEQAWDIFANPNLENPNQATPPQPPTLDNDQAEGAVAYLDQFLPPRDRETLYWLLPEHPVITTANGRVTVDNRSLRAALDELCQSTEAVHLYERLPALKAHIAILEHHANDVPDGPTANVQEILARKDFQPIRKTKTPLEHLQEWLVAWLERIFGKLPRGQQSDAESGGLWSNQWVQTGLWVSLTLLLASGAVWLARRLRRPSTEAEDGTRIILGEAVALDLDADDLLAQAQAAAEAGDWRQAVRKVYIALLHELDRREVLALNPAWTNREYLSAVRAQARLYPAMHELTDRFDRLWYGQHQGSREDYERCLSRYQEVRAALPTAA